MIIYFAVKRIKKMETYFDTLSDAFKNAPNTIASTVPLKNAPIINAQNGVMPFPPHHSFNKP